MREIKFRAWDGNQMFVPAIRHSGYDLNELLQSFGSNHDLKLMQYTGLKDKNGVEIYEGDIIQEYVKDYMFGRFVVVWNDNGFWDCGTGNKDRLVASNIYENPELLEANQ